MKKLSISIFVVFITLFGIFAVATPAHAMTCTSATFTGTVVTGTPPTHARFTYGTDYSTVANGGGIPTAVQVFSTNGTFPIEQFVSGLSESTTYYYRLEVTNNYGTSNLNIQQFATPACTPPPVQVCQDTTASNYGGALPCTYPIQTCQDTTASNYGGALPCTYPQVCRDTTAINYGGALPCTYPQICRDTTAINYGGALPCTYQNYYQPIPTVNIYANPSSIDYGDSSTITWNSTNASYCSANGGGSNNWYGTQNINGSFYTGILYSTTTYNITCTSSTGQQANASTTVYVNNQNYYQQPIYQQPIIYQQPVYQPQVIQPVYQPVVNNSLTVVTTQATQVLDTSAQLNSLIGSSANTNSSTNAWFEWGRTIDLGNTTTIAPVGALPSVIHTDTLTGLDAGTTYYFRAVAQNSSLKTTGSILSFTTTGVQNPTTVVQYVNKTNPSSLVLITSSVNRDQAVVPTIDNTRPHPGDEINYTVDYQNVGNSSITNLSLQITLPQEVTYLSSTPDNPNILGSNLVFSLGTLKGNGQGSVTIKTQVNSDATAGTLLNFPATLSYVDPSGQPQSVNANVSAQVYAPSSLGAFAFGAGFFPTNIFGWLLLLILLLILILLAKYLYGQRKASSMYSPAPLPLPPYVKKTTTVIDQQPTGKKTTTTTVEQ